jgi:uncharacterized protein
MTPLGVGLVFVPELLPMLQSGDGAVSVIEIEPQTLWQLSRKNGADRYAINQERLVQLAELPQPKLFHSVGLPVGSSRPIAEEQLPPLEIMAQRLAPAWMSEHLSFNAFQGQTGWIGTGFFLPPLQASETVQASAARIRVLQRAVDVPIAFETGVNYLSPQPNQMADGEFFAAVAGAADCGIVLDLHNLWANERNGRQRVEDVLHQIPLDRVWEIHLAGGMELDGYWLDSHSSGVPEAVLELAASWIPRFPNLGAILFEMLDEHVMRLGMDGVARQLERMWSLWALRQPQYVTTLGKPESLRVPTRLPCVACSVGEWEQSLGELVIGREPKSVLGRSLSADPGVQVLTKLVSDSRSSLIAHGLRHTMTLLLTTLGSTATRELLSEFGRECTPELYVSAEADAFARFLGAKALPLPYLNEVLDFEHALIRATLYEEAGEVAFEHDPAMLFGCLEQGRPPQNPARRPTILVIRPG